MQLFSLSHTIGGQKAQEAVALKENLCYGPVSQLPPPVPSDSTHQEVVTLNVNLCYDPVAPLPSPSPPAAAAAAAEVAEYEEIGTSSSRSMQTKQQEA